MNARLAMLALFAVGSILIIGTARSIHATSRGASGNVKVVFENPVHSTPPAAEPLFPGLPTQ